MSAADNFREAAAMSRRWVLVMAPTSRDRRVHVAQVGADRAACGAAIARPVESADDFDLACRLCERGLAARVALGTLIASVVAGWRPGA